jgi:hypothetical protein
MYLAGLGAAGAAMPAWANTAIRSISTALAPRTVLNVIVQYAVDEYGNLHYRVVGSGVGWQRIVYQLDNVVININPASLDPIGDDGSGNSSGLSLLNWNYGMPGYPSVMDKLAEVTNTAEYQAINTMMSSIGASLAGMEVSAAALKIADNIPAFLGRTGVAVGFLGVGDNIMQMKKEGFNWTDFLQATGSGVILAIQIGAFFTPVGAAVTAGIFIAEMGLFFWELAED